MNILKALYKTELNSLFDINYLFHSVVMLKENKKRHSLCRIIGKNSFFACGFLMPSILEILVHPITKKRYLF